MLGRLSLAVRVFFIDVESQPGAGVDADVGAGVVAGVVDVGAGVVDVVAGVGAGKVQVPTATCRKVFSASTCSASCPSRHVFQS